MLLSYERGQNWHRAITVLYNVVWFDAFERLQWTVRVISLKTMILLVFLSFSSLLLRVLTTKANDVSGKCFMASSLTDLSTKLKICRLIQSFRENVRIYWHRSLVPLHLYRSESLLEIKARVICWRLCETFIWDGAMWQ